MDLSLILICILIAFVGYTIGWIGHIYLGHLKAPHHWIYGLVLIILGIFCFKSSGSYYLGPVMFSFGKGHFISDFNDFLEFEVYGKDKVKEKTFWGFD